MPRKTSEPWSAHHWTARASMRPRPDAAENSVRVTTALTPTAASMRPRPDAAENFRGCVFVGVDVEGFNEAAARCRGKRAFLF